MSNLNLPSMKYSDLVSSLVMLSSERKLAYATTAQRTGDVVEIRHHGNVIATLAPGMIKVDTCGWDSMTTASRLNRIVVDNGLPYRISIRKGDTKIMTDSLAIIAPLTTATFKDGVLI